MTEERLQSDIVRKFSELYPDERGQLFHVPNERSHKLQAFKAKSLGIFPGVADLLYFDSHGIIALEVKAPGSTHSAKHVRRQLEWGKVLESQGHLWFIVRSVDEAIKCINESTDNALSVQDVEKILSSGKKNYQVLNIFSILVVAK